LNVLRWADRGEKKTGWRQRLCGGRKITAWSFWSKKRRPDFAQSTFGGEGEKKAAQTLLWRRGRALLILAKKRKKGPQARRGGKKHFARYLGLAEKGKGAPSLSAWERKKKSWMNLRRGGGSQVFFTVGGEGAKT